jgi:hypothetical protein
LLRIIASLPPSSRTKAELQFVQLYVPLIVDEHLIRLGYVARWSLPDRRLPTRLVATWDVLRSLRPSSEHAYYDAIQDRDLWLIATAAEVIGADRRDHTLVGLSAATRQQLQEMVTTGIAMVASHRSTRSVPGADGQMVAADSYFNGEYDDHPDMRYAGDSDETRPSGAARTARGRSWDVSHIYRLPVLFRSLIDNRTAVGNSFPTTTDVERLVNEYVYVVFRGELRRPLPTNFFDGGDGWYRVSSAGGYPPSKYCDARRADRSCLASEAALYGWELLSGRSQPLRSLQASLLRVATSTDPADVEFRNRYYMQGGRPFAIPTTDKGSMYSLPLYTVMSASVDRP